jgi:indole-3-glycerol phosphate synthase
LEEISARQAKISLDEIIKRTQDTPETRPFFVAITQDIAAGKAAVIAEIKKASPSKGVIRKNFDPMKIASSYEQGGATCLSVLTDMDFFQGNDDHLRQAKVASNLPIMRKDFIIDPYQVYEAKVIGADCILLIAAALHDAQMHELAGIADQLGLDILVEVHNREELERAHVLRTPLIGINNRDLHTFETSLDTTIGLLHDVFPDRTVVTESGIHNKEDIKLMRKHGVDAFLIGEAFMVAEDPGEKLFELFSS